jgi:hypothetical protein
VFLVSGEASEDVVDSAQAGPVDERLFVGNPLAARREHGVRALAGGAGDRPGGVSQVTSGGMGGAGVPERGLRVAAPPGPGQPGQQIAASAQNASSPYPRHAREIRDLLQLHERYLGEDDQQPW